MILRADLNAIDSRLEALRRASGVEVFALDDEMLERALALRSVGQLKPFDEAILAAVLVKAERIAAGGAADIRFCCLDDDLLPWDKKGDWKPKLRETYDNASVWVEADFQVSAQRRTISSRDKT